MQLSEMFRAGRVNQNKNLGLYNIPVKIIKNHVDVSKQPLTYLINFSFQKIFNFLLIIVPSMFCQFLANCMKNVCILAFIRFWQNINCFLKKHLVLETTILQAMYWSDQEMEFLLSFRKHSIPLTISPI